MISIKNNISISSVVYGMILYSLDEVDNIVPLNKNIAKNYIYGKMINYDR